MNEQTGEQVAYWMTASNRFGRTTEMVRRLIQAAENAGATRLRIRVTSPDAERLRKALRDVREAVSSGECRGDEDCDHCHIVHEIIDPALSEEDRADE